MKNTQKWFLIGTFVILLISVAAVQPQLSLDEQDAIIEAVVQTMNPDNMRATIIAEVEEDLIQKFNAAGYVGLSAALMVPGNDTAESAADVLPTATPTPEMLVVSDKPESTPYSTITPTVSSTRIIETNVADYYNGAILQEDGTYRGLHAKFVQSYAYAVGGNDEEGHIREYGTAFTPNKWFNVDVVFENDGSLVWPPRMEMRHVGNVGEYTGTEVVSIDRSNNPVLPGDKAAFTISAYGSENLGWITFYFQIYDADSGNIIEGGQGSFSYQAY